MQSLQDLLLTNANSYLFFPKRHVQYFFSLGVDQVSFQVLSTKAGEGGGAFSGEHVSRLADSTYMMTDPFLDPTASSCCLLS